MFQKEVRTESFKYDICVNPAIECLGVLFVLDDFPLNKKRSNNAYVEKISKTFKPFKNHKAVSLLEELLQSQFFRYNGPVEMFLKIYYKKPLDSEFCDKFKLDKKVVDQFLVSLKDFVSQSNFNDFFEANKDEYLFEMKRFVDDLKNFSPTEYLLNFLKIKAKKLNVLLMFGVSTGNYGIEVAENPFCCVRPYKLSRNDGIDFSFDKPYVTTLLLHEFAHTIINPLTAKYRAQISKMDKEKFAICLEKNSYGDDIETVINEHIIRAIECMYVKDNFRDCFDEFINSYRQDGFLYLPEIIDLFQKYQNGNYSNFAVFFDNLIEYFEKK